ncbi:MAG: hypothetical protein J7K13_00520 [Thermoplasmata archaeon]|nr:hypothetical protein [Thermoplasmata archaeon]
MIKIGNMAKIFSLFVVIFMITTSFGPFIENFVAGADFSHISYQDEFSLTKEEKDKLDEIGSEMVSELKNYTKDFNTILNKITSESSSESSSQEEIDSAVSEIIDKYLVDDEIYNNSSLQDNNSSIQLFQLLSQELYNYTKLYTSVFADNAEKSYQKEVAIQEATLRKTDSDNNEITEKKNEDHQIDDIQINEVKDDKEETTSLSHLSTKERFLYSINKLLSKDSKVYDLVSKIFNISSDIPVNLSEDQKKIIDHEETVNIGNDVRTVGSIDAKNGIPSEESSSGISDNSDGSNGYISSTSTETISSTTGMSSSTTTGSSDGGQTTDESKNTTNSNGGKDGNLDQKKNKLLWVVTPEGDNESFGGGGSGTLDGSKRDNDTSDGYSADVWYTYYEGERVNIPLSLCAAFDLNIIAVEKIETVKGGEFFDIAPHYGGLDIADLVILADIGYHLLVIRFVVKGLVAIGKGLLIPLFFEKIINLGYELAIKYFITPLFGATTLMFIKEIRSPGWLSNTLLPAFGNWTIKALNWTVNKFIPALAKFLINKAFPVIIETLGSVTLFVYDLLMGVNVTKIIQFIGTAGREFYNLTYYLAVNIIGGREFLITNGRTAIANKTHIFDIMEMSPLNALIKKDCGSGYAIINISTTSASRTRDVVRVGIIIKDGKRPGGGGNDSGNHYRSFTSSYATTSTNLNGLSYNEGYSEGYSAGYAAGYNAGYNAAGTESASSSSSSSSDSESSSSSSSSSDSESSDSSSSDSGSASGSSSGSDGTSESSSGVPSNERPIAIINGPSSGKVGETLTFTADDSYDPDGTIVQYDWWYKGIWHNNKGSSIQITYYTYIPHTKTIKLRVHDDGAISNVTITTCYITLL